MSILFTPSNLHNAVAKQARREIIEQRRLQQQSMEMFVDMRKRLNDTDEGYAKDSDNGWESWVSFGFEPALSAKDLKDDPSLFREWRRGDYGIMTGLVKRSEMNGLGAIVVRKRNKAGRFECSSPHYALISLSGRQDYCTGS